MQRTKIFEYQGITIFFIDYSHLKSVEEITEVMNEAQEYIHTQLPLSVYILSTIEGTYFNTTIIELFAELIKSNKPFVKASAVVGISGLSQVLYNTMMQLTGRDIRTFSSLEHAKIWLSEQK